VLGAFALPDGVPPLAAAYGRTGVDPEGRVAIVRALGRIGHPSATPTLAAALADPRPAVRAAAVGAWREIRGQAGAAPVAALIDDPATDVRREAAAVVGAYR